MIEASALVRDPVHRVQGRRALTASQLPDGHDGARVHLLPSLRRYHAWRDQALMVLDGFKDGISYSAECKSPAHKWAGRFSTELRKRERSWNAGEGETDGSTTVKKKW